MSVPSRCTLLSRYRLRDRIGSGGSSVVYRADTAAAGPLPIGSPVAVKIADAQRCADHATASAFDLQADIVSGIRHPNVLSVLDCGEIQGRPFLVMPLVEGIDLAGRLAACDLSAAAALRIVGHVAAGLDATHEVGVLHLDVKPANVLLGRLYGAPDRPAGCAEAVVLTDFGCGVRLDDDSRAPDRFVGSPRYASPERLRGEVACPGADVYSLTCLLFACLAGRPPYVGDVPTVVGGHLAGAAPSLTALTGLPAAMDEVIAVGLAADPIDRFGSCAELIDAAGAALAAA